MPASGHHLPGPVPKNFSEKEVEDAPAAPGLHPAPSRSKIAAGSDPGPRPHRAGGPRPRHGGARGARSSSARARSTSTLEDRDRPRFYRFSSDLHCADCDIHYAEPTPALFSFNSPLGACETCRGFGRVIGVDFGLVVPDEAKTLEGGAVRPWQTASFKECQDDLEKYAKKRKIPLDTAWRELSAEQKTLGAGRRAGMGELAQVLAGRVVRRAPLLQVAREQGLQDAHPGAALEVPRLHRVRRLPRHAAQARSAAVEDRRQVDPRPDAAADLAEHRAFFRKARRRGRGHRPAARRRSARG